MKKLIKYLLCWLPLGLFFSYYPVISLGGNESMNFELSVPLLWLVVLDIVAFVQMVRERKVFSGLKGKWGWLLFPVWVTLTLIWSLNVVRGALTVGIMWLVFFAGYAVWSFREMFDEEFRRSWLKWFFGSTILVCVWCVVQCILDLAGVEPSCSLMCEGCRYYMFGFPHPNGFAIEPQFMGNLLLAPAMVALVLFLKKKPNRKSELERSRGVVLTTAKSDSAWYSSTRSSSVAVVKTTTGSRFLCSNFLLGYFFIITTTLFLTFSRGAIYSFGVGMLFVAGYLLARGGKVERKKVAKRLGLMWGMVMFSFLFALNLQGIMAAVSPTNDTYMSGVAKVINHLSLGKIDIREGNEPVENSVENIEEKVVENSVESSEVEAVFDGYVAESTNVRMELTQNAMRAWSSDAPTALFGAGIGGAGVKMFRQDLTDSPKEIVQNEYASLLLETGLVGVFLFALVIVLIVRNVYRRSNAVLILGLLLSYGVSLMFFSGFANALQVYLLPMILVFVV